MKTLRPLAAALLVLVLQSPSVQAQQAPRRLRPAARPASPPAEKAIENSDGAPAAAPAPWSLALNLGLMTGASSSYTVTTGATTTTTTPASETNGGVFFGGEAFYDFFPYFALGADVEWTKYNYQNTALTADSEITFLAVPRVQFSLADFLLWGGLGLGGTVTSIGTTTGGGSLIVGTSSSTIGFTISPRIGVDYKLTDMFFVGALFSYLHTGGSVSTGSSATTVNNTSVIPLVTETFTRSWVEFGIRAGVRF